jgi:hypothetical protein
MSKGGFNFKGKVQAKNQQFNSGGGNIQGSTSSEAVVAILSSPQNAAASTNNSGGFNFESDVTADSQQFNEGGGNVQITHQSEQSEAFSKLLENNSTNLEAMSLIQALQAQVASIMSKESTQDQTIATLTANLKIFSNSSETNIGQLRAFYTELSQRTDSLENRLGLTEERIAQLREEMKQSGINHEDSINQILPLLGNIKALISTQQQQEENQLALETIQSDLYQASFYNKIRSELNATYLAATVVQTDIVQSSKTGMLGKVGSALETVGNYVPMIGSGVQLFGSILNLVDQNMQARLIQNYANLANDSVEMTNLANEIAIRLTQSHCLKEAISSQPEKLKQKCIGFLKSIIISFNEGAEANIVNVAMSEESSTFLTKLARWNPFFQKNTASSTVSQAQESKSNSKEADPSSLEELGASHGSLVAKLIIGEIFNGIIKAADQSTTASNIVDLVLHHYDITTDGISEESAQITGEQAAALHTE